MSFLQITVADLSSPTQTLRSCFGILLEAWTSVCIYSVCVALYVGRGPVMGSSPLKGVINSVAWVLERTTIPTECPPLVGDVSANFLPRGQRDWSLRSYSRLSRPVKGVLLTIYIKETYPRNRLWRPIGLWDVKDFTLSRQSAHRWR
jgi:hypothetical protein